MTANVGRWETVASRSKKGPSLVTKTASEKKRVAAMDQMPKLEDLVVLQPMKETQTMFGAFANVKENGTRKIKAAPTHGQGDDGHQTKLSPRPGDGANSKKREKSHAKGGAKPQTLQAAIKLLSQEALEKALSLSKKAFPNSPLLWLKDMASYLNVHFEEVPFDDPTHVNERSDFPSSELPSGLKQVVVRTLQGATNNVLEIFFYHCVQSMVTDLSKGLSIYGYQIVVQLLAYMSPAIVLGDLTKYSELLVENQGRPLRSLAVLWALGQCGLKDLPTALRVFFEIMFPAISSKQCAPFILGHLDLVLKAHAKRLHLGTKSLGLTGYFTLLDFFNQSKPTYVTSLEMKKLTKSILPKLKLIAYGRSGGSGAGDISNASSAPAANLHLFFPSYLSRVDTTGPLKGEFLASLVECLVLDPKGSFSVWRELYIKHLPQSGTLLKHLVDNQGTKMTEKISKGQLKETIQSFQITNEELRASAAPASSSRQSGGGVPAGLGLCEENCPPLLAKTEAAIEASSAVGRGKKWFLRLLTLALGFLLVDVFVLARGVLEDSLAFRLLVAAGLSSAHLDQIVGKTEMLLERAQASLLQLRAWLGADLPALYADAVDAAAPYSRVLREKALEAAVVIGGILYDGAVAAGDLWTSLVERVDAEKISRMYEESIRHLEWAWAHVSAHVAETWAFLVAQWTVVKDALESNEAALGLWLAVVEAWELVAAVVTNVVAQTYAWCRQSFADLESMIQ